MPLTADLAAGQRLKRMTLETRAIEAPVHRLRPKFADCGSGSREPDSNLVGVPEWVSM